MEFYLVVEIVGSLVYLVQKVLLSFNKRIGWLFGCVGAVAFTISLLGILLVLILNLGSPNWVLESVEVILFAIGAVFLVLRKPFGWALYGLGHLVLIYYAFLLGTYFIMALQVASIPFAVIGYRNFKRALSP